MTCRYAPPIAGYISVEWRYSTTGYDWNTANQVYSYLSPGIIGTSAEHLTNRSNHTHEPEQIKLYIYDLQDTDGGNYFCQIVGGNTLRDNVTFQPISEYDMFVKQTKTNYIKISFWVVIIYYLKYNNNNKINNKISTNSVYLFSQAFS